MMRAAIGGVARSPGAKDALDMPEPERKSIESIAYHRRSIGVSESETKSEASSAVSSENEALEVAALGSRPTSRSLRRTEKSKYPGVQRMDSKDMEARKEGRGSRPGTADKMQLLQDQIDVLDFKERVEQESACIAVAACELVAKIMDQATDCTIEYVFQTRKTKKEWNDERKRDFSTSKKLNKLAKHREFVLSKKSASIQTPRSEKLSPLEKLRSMRSLKTLQDFENLNEKTLAYSDLKRKYELAGRGLPSREFIRDYEYSQFKNTLQELRYGTLLTQDLTIIDLAHRRLGDDRVRQLCNALELSQIVNLILAGNLITDAGLGPVATMMRTLKHIENLNLSENNFGDEGLTYFLNPENFPKSLKALHLNRNLVTAKSAIYLTRLMQPHLKMNLDRLYLGGAVNGRGWGDEFAAVFTNNMVSLDTRPLKKLSLPDANMTSLGLHYMAMMLICADRVELLNIARNDFTGQASQDAVLLALTINPMLKELNIRRCGIDLATQAACNEQLNSVVYETWAHEVTCATVAGKEIAYTTQKRSDVDRLVTKDWIKPYITDWSSNPFEYLKNDDFLSWTNVEAMFFGISKEIGASQASDIKFCEFTAKFIGKLEFPLRSNVEDLEKETVQKPIMQEIYAVTEQCLRYKALTFDMRKSIEAFFTHIRTPPESMYKKKMIVDVKIPKCLCNVLHEGHLMFELDDDDEFRDAMWRENEQLGMILEDWRGHQRRCCEAFQYAIGHSHTVLTLKHFQIHANVRPRRRLSRAGSIMGIEAVDVNASTNESLTRRGSQSSVKDLARARRLSSSKRRMSEILRPLEPCAPAVREKSHFDVKFGIVKAYFEMEDEYQMITGALPNFPRLKFAASYVHCVHQYFPGRMARLQALAELAEKERQKELRLKARLDKKAKRNRGLRNLGFNLSSTSAVEGAQSVEMEVGRGSQSPNNKLPQISPTKHK